MATYSVKCATSLKTDLHEISAVLETLTSQDCEGTTAMVETPVASSIFVMRKLAPNVQTYEVQRNTSVFAM